MNTEKWKKFTDIFTSVSKLLEKELTGKGYLLSLGKMVIPIPGSLSLIKGRLPDLLSSSLVSKIFFAHTFPWIRFLSSCSRQRRWFNFSRCHFYFNKHYANNSRCRAWDMEASHPPPTIPWKWIPISSCFIDMNKTSMASPSPMDLPMGVDSALLGFRFWIIHGNCFCQNHTRGKYTPWFPGAIPCFCTGIINL